MKDLSLFLLKNTFGSKMRKGFRNFCNGEGSTSTLNQQKLDGASGGSAACTAEPPLSASGHPTLEEMIMQLEIEEKMGGPRGGGFQHRMSCVNSSDILRSARNALNQYPRFSLDGKDSMYRSSFIELTENHDRAEKPGRFPSMVGGESVLWCKPGVVGRLMGLEAMPVPLNINYRRERLSAIIKNQNLRKRAVKHEENERKRATSERRRRGVVGSCSRTGYCVMKPVELNVPVVEAGWPVRRFL